MKKATIIIWAVLFLGTIVYLFCLNEAFNRFDVGPVDQGEQVVKTRLGDEFLFEYTSTNFPGFNTSVIIKQMPEKEKIGDYHLEREFTRPQILVKINSNELVCYEMEELVLVYKENGQDYKTIYLSYIEDKDPNQELDLVSVSNVLVEKHQWKYVKYCGEFLLKAGDSNIRTMLEQYAKGIFTEDELNINKSSKITKEEMIKFAETLLNN